jgi:hypothetical protein
MRRRRAGIAGSVRNSRALASVEAGAACSCDVGTYARQVLGKLVEGVVPAGPGHFAHLARRKQRESSFVDEDAVLGIASRYQLSERAPAPTVRPLLSRQRRR